MNGGQYWVAIYITKKGCLKASEGIRRHNGLGSKMVISEDSDGQPLYQSGTDGDNEERKKDTAIIMYTSTISIQYLCTISASSDAYHIKFVISASFPHNNKPKVSCFMLVI